MDNLKIQRVLSHGQIADLSSGFALQNKAPFSLYIRPKYATLNRDILVSCKCICDNQMSALPAALNDWTPAAIVEIAPNAIDLVEYEVYWGAANPNNI